jgi:hypothetical protein
MYRTLALARDDVPYGSCLTKYLNAQIEAGAPALQILTGGVRVGRVQGSSYCLTKEC